MKRGQLLIAGSLHGSDKKIGLTVSALCQKEARWRTLSRCCKFEVHHHAVATLSGELYVIGGKYCLCKPGATPKVSNKVSTYTVAQNKWKQISPMRESRIFHSAVTYQGAIYVVGGINAQNK